MLELQVLLEILRTVNLVMELILILNDRKKISTKVKRLAASDRCADCS